MASRIFNELRELADVPCSDDSAPAQVDRGTITYLFEHGPMCYSKGRTSSSRQSLLAISGHDGADIDVYDAEVRNMLSVSAQLTELVVEGEDHVRKLYSYRGYVNAVPQVTKELDDRKETVHQTVFEVLRENIAKLHAVFDYKETVKRVLQSVLRDLTPGKYTVIPSHVQRVFAQLFDVIVQIDTLKDVKSAMKNELSHYKRSFSAIKHTVQDGDVVDARNRSTQMFLSMPGSFFDEIKRTVHEQTNADAVVKTVLSHTVNSIQNQQFISAAEKHQMIRAMIVLFILLDREVDPKDKKRKGSVFVDKEIDHSSIYRILKTYPVVPLFGDMPLQLVLVMRRAPSLTEDDLYEALGSDAAREDTMKGMLLRNHWRTMRDASFDFSVKLTRVISRTRAANVIDKAKGADLPGKLPSIVQDVWDTTNQGVRLLADWTSKVLEQAAVKYVLLAPRDVCIDAGVDPSKSEFEYEQAVRCNYALTERSVLIDVIGMIKTTSASLLELVTEFSPLLRMQAHSQIQWLVHGLVTDQMTKALRNKDEYVRDMLLRIRTICAEWSEAFRGDASAQESQYIAESKHKKVQSTRDQVPSNLPAGRIVGPSSTQRLALQTALEFLVDPNSKFMHSGTLVRKKKLILEEKIDALQRFASDLSYYPAMLDMGAAIRSASDLGQLWFRELYLDRCKVVQFPIETSLPWILTEHCIASESPVLLQNMFYVLDMYNDAADYALRDLQQQFLFDEIEAEVNLVFDQFVVLIAKSVYETAKTMAAIDTFSPEAKRLWDEYCVQQTKHAGTNQEEGTTGQTTEHSSAHPHLSAAGHAVVEKARRASQLLHSRKGFRAGLSDLLSRGAGPEAFGVAGQPKEFVLLGDDTALSIILSQHHIRLLGRQIDVAYLLSTHFDRMMNKDIGDIFVKFENDTLAGVIDFDCSLQILRGAHQILTRYITMEDFDAIVSSADVVTEDEMSGSVLSNSVTRTAWRIIELCGFDLLPHYAYSATTRRFIRAAGMNNGADPTALAEEVITESRQYEKLSRRARTHRFTFLASKVSRPLAASTRYMRDFVGAQHAEAIVRVLGPRGVARLVQELIASVTVLITGDLKAYVPILLEGLPPTSFPKFQYRSGGVYGYYEAKLQGVLEYEDLKPRVFQTFREIGNMIAFAQLLDNALARADLTEFSLSSSFVFPPEASGMKSKNEGFKPVNSDKNMLGHADKSPPLTRMAQAVQYLCQMAETEKSVGFQSGSSNALVETASQTIDIYNSTKYPVPVLAHVLLRLAEIIHTSEQGDCLANMWGGSRQASMTEHFDILSTGTQNTEFHRLWSALLFIYSMPDRFERQDKSSEFHTTSLDHNQFGDGFLLCGAALLHLLNQWHRFQLYDFTHYVLRVARHEEAGKNAITTDKEDTMVGMLDPAMQEAFSLFRVTAQEAVDRLHQTHAMVETQLPSPLPTVQDVDLHSSWTHQIEFEPPEEDEDDIVENTKNTKFVVSSTSRSTEQRQETKATPQKSAQQESATPVDTAVKSATPVDSSVKSAPSVDSAVKSSTVKEMPTKKEQKDSTNSGTASQTRNAPPPVPVPRSSVSNDKTEEGMQSPDLLAPPKPSNDKPTQESAETARRAPPPVPPRR